MGHIVGTASVKLIGKPQPAAPVDAAIVAVRDALKENRLALEKAREALTAQRSYLETAETTVRAYEAIEAEYVAAIDLLERTGQDFVVAG